MSILDAIILGLVQGITEFLPVSSSGHLVITSYLLGSSDAFTFNVLLNFGSLAALVVYYRARIISMITGIINNKDWNLALKLILAMIPAVVIGLTFASYIEQLNEYIWVVVATLIIVGVLMILFGKAKEDADDRDISKSVGWKLSLKFGLAQALALVPGVSRSGITILTGINSKLSAEKATEFSFLLAIPIIAGASLKVLLSPDGLLVINNNLLAFIIGNIVCFISGILAINFLTKLVGRRGLKDFGWYRVGLASVLAILLLTGTI
jgi:undecaprenyl-diphosphatase